MQEHFKGLLSLCRKPSLTATERKSMHIKFAAGVKKSKEIVENWNQRFPDTKALISIVNFGKGSE